jgi:hypothetical protein
MRTKPARGNASPEFADETEHPESEGWWVFDPESIRKRKNSNYQEGWCAIVSGIFFK